MVAIPFPYGTSAGEKVIGRMEMRASPLDTLTVENERRFRAEVERALRAGDDALAQIERRLRTLEDITLP